MFPGLAGGPKGRGRIEGDSEAATPPAVSAPSSLGRRLFNGTRR